MRHAQNDESHNLKQAGEPRPMSGAVPGISRSRGKATRKLAAERVRPITAIVAEPSPILRNAIKTHLEAEPDITVSHTVVSSDRAISAAIADTPDVITLDLDLDLAEQATAKPAFSILTQLRDAAVVVFSDFRTDQHIRTALDAGATALVSKLEDPDILAHAARAADAGEDYISPLVRERLVATPKQKNDPQAPAEAIVELKPRSALLTQREIEVLVYIASGLSKKEIASAMHLSVKTIDNHSTNLMTKLDIHDRVQLARYAIREGLSHC